MPKKICLSENGDESLFSHVLILALAAIGFVLLAVIGGACD